MPPNVVVQIADAPASVPHGITLAGARVLEPLSLNVEIDGAGASAAFLPCLSVYAPSGELLSRTSPGTMQVGDDAKITFAPFLEPAVEAARQSLFRFNAISAQYWTNRLVATGADTEMGVSTVTSGPSDATGDYYIDAQTATGRIRLRRKAGGIVYFAKVEAWWTTSFAGYRSVWIDYRTSLNAVANVAATMSVDPASVQTRVESDRLQYQQVNAILSPFVTSATLSDYLELAVYARQESGVNRNLEVALTVHWALDIDDGPIVWPPYL